MKRLIHLFILLALLPISGLQAGEVARWRVAVPELRNEAGVIDQEADNLTDQVRAASSATAVPGPVVAPGGVNPGPAGIEWVRIPDGSFTMGANDGDDNDEKPVHRVTLSSFEMSRTEVTVAQYRACVNAGACTKPVTGGLCNWDKSGREDHPINCVDWDQAVAFAKWAGGRLPTEAEWEYAARAGTTTRYVCGDSDSCLGSMGWYLDNSGGDTHPVAKKKANSWGMYDMSGNVFEWVSDWYSESYYTGNPESNPQGPSDGSYRVVRGGSGHTGAQSCRSAKRFDFPPCGRVASLGFRLAR